MYAREMRTRVGLGRGEEGRYHRAHIITSSVLSLESASVRLHRTSGPRHQRLLTSNRVIHERVDIVLKSRHAVVNVGRDDDAVPSFPCHDVLQIGTSLYDLLKLLRYVVLTSRLASFAPDANVARAHAVMCRRDETCETE